MQRLSSIVVTCLALQLVAGAAAAHTLKRSVAIFDMQMQRASTSSEGVATMELLYGSAAAGKLSSIGKNVVAQLATALTRTNQFLVLERERIDTVIREQAFGQSGFVDANHAIQAGKLLGAQFGIIGTITEGSVAEEGNDLVARFALQLRIVNTTTGEISEAEQAREEIKARKGERDEDNLLADAVNKGVDEVVSKLVNDIQGQAFNIGVSAIDGKEITIAAGQNSGLEAGQVFKCVKKGKELKDPATGESLGFKTQEIGTMTVTSVERKFAVAQVTTGCKGLKVGDLARAVTEK